MTDMTLPEGVVRFTHALVEDAALRSWFLSLEHLPASVRRAAFSQMADQMRANSEDPDLATAIAAMTRPELFDAVRNTVQERCGL